MCLGVPPRKASGSRFPLQLRALITALAGFPLQSLTQQHRNLVRRLVLANPQHKELNPAYIVEHYTDSILINQSTATCQTALPLARK